MKAEDSGKTVCQSLCDQPVLFLLPALWGDWALPSTLPSSHGRYTAPLPGGPYVAVWFGNGPEAPAEGTRGASLDLDWSSRRKEHEELPMAKPRGGTHSDHTESMGMG